MKEIALALGLKEDAAAFPIVAAISDLKEKNEALKKDVARLNSALKKNAADMADMAAKNKLKGGMQELHKTELDKIARTMMKVHKSERVYMTGDGQAFLDKEDAGKHGKAIGVGVTLFGKAEKTPEEEETEE